MAVYKLKVSFRAEQQLEKMYLDGCVLWGIKQADEYYDNLINHFDLLCESPLLFVSVDSIRPGYRRSVCAKHSIYYRVKNNTIEVMGVLKKQSTTKQL